MTEHFIETVSTDSNRVVVKVSGDVDHAAAPDLYRRLLEQGASVRRLVVDLGDVNYLDSAGLAALDMLHRSLSDAGQSLRVIARPNCVARHAIELCALDQVLDVVDRDG